MNDEREGSASKSGNGTEIWVNEFTEASAQQFREQVLERADRDGHNVITIYIDSYGGMADSLAKMIETMDEVPNRFVTVAMGKAMSCGAILLSHGDIRFCGRYSRVMVHNVATMTWGDIYSIKSGTDEAMRLNKMFIGLLAKNCNMSYDKLQDMIKTSTDSKEIWMGAEDALKFGIIDKIGVPELFPMIQWGCEVVPPKTRMKLDEAEAYPPKKIKKKTKKK